jgi:hypothetical protein
MTYFRVMSNNRAYYSHRYLISITDFVVMSKGRAYGTIGIYINNWLDNYATEEGFFGAIDI